MGNTPIWCFGGKHEEGEKHSESVDFLYGNIRRISVMYGTFIIKHIFAKCK